MNSYPRHVGDFIRDTVGLSMVEDGAYNRLLDQYYAREAPLPLAPADVYRLARATSRAERAAVDYVLATFFERLDDGWHQKRADEELSVYRQKSDAARKSAAVRWQSERNANASPPGMRTQCDGNASQYPIAKNQEPKNQEKATAKAPRASALAIEPPEGVRPEVWQAWQRHRGKKLTPDAIRLQAKQLAEFAALGDDPNEVIEQSIRGTWAGIFRIKGDNKRNGATSHDERRQADREHTAYELTGGRAGRPRERVIGPDD